MEEASEIRWRMFSDQGTDLRCASASQVPLILELDYKSNSCDSGIDVN